MDILEYIKQMQEMYGEDVITTADKIKRPEPKPIVKEIEAFNEFMKRNPKADGGQLVAPSVDGSRPGYASKKITDPKQLKLLEESAKKYGYDSYADVPDTKQKEPGKSLWGDKEKILSDVRRRLKGVPEGRGSPGVPRPVGEDFVSPMKDPEIAAKNVATRKKNYQASPIGERLQWIADNGKNHDNPKNFIKAYEKHFKHKIGSKKDALFGKVKDKTRLYLSNIDGLQNTGKFIDVFSFKKGFSEEEIFKASIIQNNPKIKKEFKTLFNDVYKNVSVYSELGPEGIVERLNKGKLLKEFDFVKFGVGSGIARNSLLNVAGVNPEHISSFQNVRKPIMAISQIIENLKNPSFAKDFKISPTTATKIRGQLENFLEGEKNLRADIKKINNQLGDVKFNNIFGGVNFEHTLAKQFGKDYKYLPRNYLLKGQFTSQAFNMMKKNAFDLPLINLMKQYEQGKVSGAKIQEFIDDFNAKTNNYADFKFDSSANKGKGGLSYLDNKISYDLSRYNDPKVARQELIDNIKLTQSKTFQKGMKGTIGSGNQLKLFRSKEAKQVLSELEKLGCGKAAGGRILMSNGGATLTKCARKGSNKLEKILLKGGANKNEQVLAKQVLRAGAGLKSMLSLRSFLGPAALAFTAATEAGIVGYDMLAEGKTFKEAVGDSVFNYALGPKLKIDSIEERNKRFRKLGVSEKDMGKIAAYEAALSDIDRADNLFVKDQMTKQKLEEAKKFFPAVVDKRQKEADAVRADIQDLMRTGTEQRLMNVDYDAGAKALEEAKKLATIDRLTSRGPQIFGQIFPKAEKSRQQRVLDASSIVNPAHQYQMDNLFMYPYGLAGGGIVGLSGSDKSGPPPTGGPMSQGLRSLYNNGKKL